MSFYLKPSDAYADLHPLAGSRVLLYKGGVGFGGKLVAEPEHGRYTLIALDGQIVIPFGVENVGRIEKDPTGVNPNACIVLS